jgi:hypothetical protein
MTTPLPFRVVVTKPASHAIVGRTAAVSGTCVGQEPGFVVKEVRVSLGGGAEGTAPVDLRRRWSCEVTAPPTPQGGTPLTIVAQAYGTEEFDTALVKIGTPRKVDVILDGTVPDLLTIDSFATPVTTQPGQPYVLDLSGTAGDAHSGITAVGMQIDSGPFVAVDELVEKLDAGGRRIWLWTKKAVEVFADVQGDHRFTVRATDGAGNVITGTRDIRVRLPFEPGPVEQVFGPTRYLAELLTFARRYVRVGGATGTLTAKMLADRFHQPFDRLTDPALFEQAIARVPRSRIAAEVLRGHLASPAPGRRFRDLAYQTFLRGLGTSYDELRLARTDDSRAALAERLGIGPAAAGAARIRELTIPPDTVTDHQLESLFGYRSALTGDPLRPASGPATGTAQVLLWKRDALRARWHGEDSARRDSPADPLPIIDPDLVAESQIRTRTPDDPAYALWTGRQKWISDKLAEIGATQATAAELTRFDAVVRAFAGAFEPSLAALGEQDANGVDVRPELPHGLDLDAFRYLVRSRALLAAGTDLDSGWDDVVAILLQVQKRRRYRPWRTEENRASLVLEPAYFTLGAAGDAGPAGVSRWRFRRAEHAAWRRTLAARAAAAAALDTGYQRVIEATEATVLPQLRDALIERLADEEAPEEAAERLTRDLLIDLRADGGQRTTRVDQALDTLRGVLFTARNGSLRPDAAGRPWTIKIEPTHVTDGAGHTRLTLEFDREWAWMSGFRSWLSATRVFAYPENQLLPTLYRADGERRQLTAAYPELIKGLRAASRVSPDDAQELADPYAKYLREHGVVGDTFPPFTNQLPDAVLVTLRDHSQALENVGNLAGREVFWLAPMAIAGKLRESGQFQAALDWYKRVYAFHLPPANRKIYVGLTAEDRPSSYDRTPEWLLGEVNPHEFATDRRHCYTKATIMAIAGCFSAFADDEFDRGSADGNARARTLYETAIDLLGLPEFGPEHDEPFPPNPVRKSMLDHARSGLTKIHHGLNIAGVANPATYESTLPSQYRYGVLVERAKNLVSIAQQIEASYLAALEQRDAKAYDELRARHDLEVAGATVDIHTTKLAEAVTGVRVAELQRQRAELQEDHFTKLIDDGYNAWETAAQLALGAAAYLHAAAGVASVEEGFLGALTFGVFGNSKTSASTALTAFAAALSTAGQIAQIRASHERQVQEWQLQKDLAAKDGEIADKQVQAAEFQLQLAGQERQLAILQQDHAQAVATFLATRFTNAELFEWMSGVLGRVYAFFLQQATGLAQLAEAQLAFERQELPAGFIGSGYWRDATAGTSAPDRRGLTGSARLLEDVTRLDQYAFDTDRRKLHLTQTFPLSQIAAFEVQQFRETGVLTFATPEVLFDREFPGHYLRLIKRVKMSVVALLPPVRGVRATLAASGVSRTVVARGPFDTVSLRRDPELIAFTSSTNATGLFDLEPEGGLLLPFEGMGVDTVWQLELPKAANPFDYRSIADVLLTIEYTALESAEYRERVVRELDRRFSGDRTFSVRNQFPDAWYELNNPETVEPEHRMRAVLPITAGDLPPHIQDLHVEQISLFVVRADALTDELTITSLSHTTDGQTVASAEVITAGGIISTRRPAGAAWNIHLHADPTGTWEIQLPDDELVRSWFRDELIQDLVLVLTLGGTTPEWP